ncbi:SDR family oxidoreductase [Sphingobium sufflavum]|uniref:SDR family NAD(P)-dependent oxidoreductase n=1 Tax=Sphingobium sufflavum TaxID=1129547 RepID=UPI001F2D56E8|nr:SDR family NAD(P)-dependent oxidoreductase [Sphingobium sufflavum]MCE7796873.1 SDR family oxidoreductase [Sphingobium sufflavum]
MDTGLAGKTVIITGATANIGRAIALDFAAEGARLLLVGRDAEAGARVVALATERGAQAALFLAADMTDPAAPARIVEAAETLGPVEVLVNNVGGNVGMGVFADSDPATWAGDIDINLGTVLRMTHAVLPGMIARKSGSIVNMGSTAGIVGDYMLPVYSAAKSAVHGFTVILAKELGQHGIRVNCVAPYGTMSADPDAYSKGSRFNRETGFMMTAFADVPAEEKSKRARKPVLARQVAMAEEVSSAVVYLASTGASYMTGQIVQVDGGSLL